MTADASPALPPRSPSPTLTAHPVQRVATRRCPACPDAKPSATAALPTGEPGYTSVSLACQCGLRFPDRAGLLAHWRAAHEDAWADRNVPPLAERAARGVLV